jgi:hypothetical protein
MEVYKPMSLDDVGTRAEHLMDLQTIWGFAYQMLTTDIYHTEGEVHQAAELATALDLLTNYMMSGRDLVTLYAKVINDLPRAEFIDRPQGESNYGVT